MKKELATLATVTTLAGAVAVATQGNQVSAATTTTPATPTQTQTTADQLADAKQDVTAATKDVKAAQKTAAAADQDTQNADQEQAVQANELDAAKDSQKQAAADQAAATPEGIKQATTAVDDAQKQATTAQTTVDQANTDADAAKQTADAASKTADAADAADAKAQDAVKSAQADVKTAQDNQDAAQNVTATKAAETQAQAAVTKAQGQVDATNKAISDLNANADASVADGTIGFTVPGTYKAAYEEWLDQYTEPGTAIVNKLTQLQKQVEDSESQFSTDGIGLAYKPSQTDQDTKIADVADLTVEQTQELTEFAASIINAIREKQGLKPLKVTAGSALVAHNLGDYAYEYGGDDTKYVLHLNEAWGGDGVYFGGNHIESSKMNKIVSDTAEKAGLGITEYSNEGVKDIELNANIADINGYEWTLFSTKNQTMATLKSGIAEFIAGELDGNDKGSITGANLGYLGQVLFANGFGDDVVDAIGVSYDKSGMLKVFTFGDIPADSVFWVTAKTPIAKMGGTSTGVDQTKLAALQKQLTADKQQLTKAQTAYTAAKDATAKATAAAKQDAATRQAQLDAAKTALTVAQQAAEKTAAAKDTAATALKQANAELATKQARVKSAVADLSVAQDQLADAKQHLANLQNADANLTKADAALASAQTAYNAAVAQYNAAKKVSDAASADLAQAKKVLATTKDNLNKLQRAQDIADQAAAAKAKKVREQAAKAKNAKVKTTLLSTGKQSSTLRSNATATQLANAKQVRSAAYPQTGNATGTAATIAGALLVLATTMLGFKKREDWR